jgi:hypothetical protein
VAFIYAGNDRILPGTKSKGSHTLSRAVLSFPRISGTESATHPAPRDEPGYDLRFPALKRNQQLVWAFDFIFGLEEFLTPWLACALGALVDHVTNRETVIAGSFRAVARKLVTCLTGLEELAFECSVLPP